MLHRRLRLIISFIIIIAICWIDYQFLTEKNYVTSESRRRIYHLLLLVAILPVGYWGWYAYPMQWIKKMWLASYIFVIVLIGAIGLLQLKFNLFSTSFLDSVMSLRIFFCSPLPFLILYVLGRISRNVTTTR